MVKNYPECYKSLLDMQQKLSEELPGPMKSFDSLYQEVLTDAALDRKAKELIALGIGIAVRCDGCISYHVHDALEAGATRKEIIETIGVAILMGGGPSMVYGCEALEALDQFEEDA